MAHFAKLDENNNVIDIIVIGNDDVINEEGIETEQVGLDYIANHLKLTGTWKQTSYNTFSNKHYVDMELGINDENLSSDQTKAFRYNYAEVGGSYDVDNDAFIPPQNHTTWILDEGFRWRPPVTPPWFDEEGNLIPDMPDYYWDDDTISWVQYN